VGEPWTAAELGAENCAFKKDVLTKLSFLLLEPPNEKNGVYLLAGGHLQSLVGMFDR
jgi:hypothetical protein